MVRTNVRRARDFRQHLEVETPEHVVLDLEIAGVGSRLLAAVIDTAILAGLTLAMLVLALILADAGVIPTGRWMGLVVAGWSFVAWMGYHVFFEGFRRGRTPGKAWVGLRVVRDTGHPITIADAMTRNLLRLADFLPPPYLGGLLLMALHPLGKRLGDLAAGTVVIRDEPMAVAAPPVGLDAATPAAAPLLTDPEFGVLAQFVARAGQLEPDVLSRLAGPLAERFAAHLGSGGDAAARLAELHRRETERRRGPLAGTAGVRARFAARQAPRWTEFRRLAERATLEGLDSFRPEELPDFAARYREAAADLARARTYRAEPATIGQLERLVAAGHSALYRDERSTWRALWNAVARECPAAVLHAWRTVLLTGVVFVATGAIGYRVIRDRPALAEELLPEEMLRRADAGHDRTLEGRKYGEVTASQRPLVASFIIMNNVRVAVLCLAGGIFAGVGSLVLLAFNGLMLGSFAGHFANQGLLWYLLEFVVGHGVLELTAICIAAAAGLMLGLAVIAPGDLSRSDALVLRGRVAIRMIGMAVVLLAIAGLIEGFLSVAGGGAAPRVAAATASLGFLVLYLVNGARAGDTDDPGIGAVGKVRAGS
jgi:uncharacterized membrane protein SpoIIM required for sporulation/uncharacterized RDD family membrane protein YckC